MTPKHKIKLALAAVALIAMGIMAGRYYGITPGLPCCAQGDASPAKNQPALAAQPSGLGAAETPKPSEKAVPQKSAKTAAPAAVKKADTSAPVASVKKETVSLYYFHGTARCRTCLRIEQWTSEAAKANGLGFVSVNLDEDPAAQDYITRYGLTAKTVVAANIADAAKWRNLNRVWLLSGDEAAFKDYIKTGAGQVQ